jgi:hypothetical protein
MEHKKHLEKLNQDSLRKLEAYIQSKGGLKQEEHERLRTAKEDWQQAWTKLMEALLILERIEI